MKKRIKRLTVDATGYGLIAVGIVAIPVPIISGVPIVVVGVYLLSLHSEWFHTRLHHYGRRFPNLIGFIDSFDGKVRRFLNIPV